MSIPPTDLEIRILTEKTPEHTRLRYVLHSPAGKVGYTHLELEGRTSIHGRPEEFQARMLAGLEKLDRGLASDGSSLLREEVPKELEAIGRELYQDLFPKALKVEYRQFRAQIATLLIISDEPWIPWELIKPYGEDFDDDFLCCRFELTRWLAGETTPAKEFGAMELGAARVACFEAGNVSGADPLPRAAEEGRILGELAGRHSGVESLLLTDATYDEVEETLRLGGAGILHFIGHSEFEPAEPNVSRFLLGDGRSFRPRDLLHSGIESRIRLLVPLLREIYRMEEGHIRVVLLARAALDWWEQLKRESAGVGELLSGPATSWHQLQPLATTARARSESYHEAARVFSEHLHKPALEADPADLGARYYDRVLLLHMRALADIEGAAAESRDGLLDHVLRRERRFWERIATRQKLPESLTEGIGRAMALITLGGGARDEDHAVQTLGALRVFEGQDRSVLVRIARLLHETYPGTKWIEPILPDLLGEHLQRRELEKGSAELLKLAIGTKTGSH